MGLCVHTKHTPPTCSTARSAFRCQYAAQTSCDIALARNGILQPPSSQAVVDTVHSLTVVALHVATSTLQQQ